MERSVSVATLSLALLLTHPAQPADIEAKLVIDQVTVYPQTANITRSGKVTVPAGSNRLIVRGLPDPIDTSNLRIYANSTAVRLGGVEVQKIVDKDYVSDAERVFAQRLLTLQDQRVALQDDIHTAESQLKLIDSLASLPTDHNGKSTIESASIQGTLTTIGTGSQAARAKIRSANIAIRDLDDETALAKAELAKIATARLGRRNAHQRQRIGLITEFFAGSDPHFVFLSLLGVGGSFEPGDQHLQRAGHVLYVDTQSAARSRSIVT